ncbi:hypothetical protein WN48_09127 [Eufriesea mexicana]|nr:hypothetical protein WN48_09127 [Eufriesea mexicana]
MVAKEIFQSHRRQYLRMFMGVWQRERPRNEMSSNAPAATTVVDMAQENRLGAEWTNNSCLLRKQTNKPEDTVDDDDDACAGSL